MDYKQLLMQYMLHVEAAYGTYFNPKGRMYLRDEEMKELEKLAEALDAVSAVLEVGRRDT